MITIQYVDDGLIRWARTYRMPADGRLRTKHWELDLRGVPDGDTISLGWPVVDDGKPVVLPLTWGEQ